MKISGGIDMDVIDYKKLLIKYIDHVSCSEGTDFLSHNDFGVFTEQEWRVLQELRTK